MRKSRFTESQMLAILKKGKSGLPVAEVCRKHGISNTTFYQWKSRYGWGIAQPCRRKSSAPCRRGFQQELDDVRHSPQEGPLAYLADDSMMSLLSLQTAQKD